MMGADVEAMISGVDGVKDAAMDAIISLANATGYQLISSAMHAGVNAGPCAPQEVPVSPGDCVSGISSAMAAISSNMGKMGGLDSGMYTGSNTFTNSIGSPWKELNQLQKAVSAATSYACPLNWVGSKAGLLALLNMVVQCAVDAKSAITSYHDWVQRGFDHVYNGDVPSITHTTDPQGGQTIGMVNQQYNDNVNIPQPSIDPF